MTPTDERRDDTASPPAGDRDSGRDRLRRSLQPRISRGQAVVGGVLAILGFLAVVQVQTINDDTEFAGARREDLITLLDSLERASRQAREEIADLEERRDSLRSSTERRETAIEEAEDQVETLSVLAGTVPARGPGISVTIIDPADEVGTTTLLNALQEMRNAGAEAIEINNKVRVVASTSFVDTEEGVSVDGTVLTPPYVFEVIGPPTTLEEAMTFRGGLTDEIEELGGEVYISTSDSIEIESLHTPEPPQYAQPAPDQ
ncbi:MAG TPA: DUF881 domain-containing protein [Nocardioidaceae bacterium]|nr:DUF881 domain-containing protein [Nocardioidaceae bacterium]